MASTGKFSVQTTRQGLHEITGSVVGVLRNSEIQDGLCTVFIRHTSASLIIQENADPSAKRDLETWLNRLVKPEEFFTHTSEGPDDMPSHIKAALTQTSISIPIVSGQLMLGTWQGIYLWEHREHSHSREIVVCCMG